MIFPETPRIIYSKNPLDEVICQLRFPTILGIEKDIPYEFQESIRKDFPQYVEEEEFQIPLPGSSLENVPVELFELAKNSINRKNFSFLSENSKWKINLTRDFISISTVDYTRWEVFRDYFTPALDNFIRIYKPAYYSRIGLRYRDVICKSSLNLSNEKWSELLHPSIIGLLGDDDLENHVQEISSNTLLDLGDDSSKVKIQNGFILLKNEEKGFLIDSDFFSLNRTEIHDAMTKLDFFHECASRLIRWSITEKLHNTMEPKGL